MKQRHCVHQPATRFLCCGIEIEDVFKVIQTEHLLVQCIQLDTALKVRQSKCCRGLKTENKTTDYMILIYINTVQTLLRYL